MDENYAYLNARIAAMKSNLFPLLTYQKMLLMELPEITRYISEGAYKEDVTELSKTFKGIELIEYALNLNLARTYQHLIQISQGRTRDFITHYMKRWDNENIKTVLRGRRSGVGSDEISETLVPIGKLKFSYLISLSKKEYSEIYCELEEKSIIPRGCESLPELEKEMDRIYYHGLIVHSRNIGEDELSRYVKKEIDMRNLKSILRMKRANASYEGIIEELIPLGTKIVPSSLEQLKGHTYEEMLIWARRTFHDLKIDTEESLAVIEQDIDRHLILYGEKISHLHMFSPLIVLGYILRKYQEIANLRLIVKGKHRGLPSDIIEKMLVV